MNDAPSYPVRLNQQNLSRLSPAVQIPAYDRRGIRHSIVHIGVGGFHRAHQAVYLDELLGNPENRGWGLCGVGLLDQDARMRDALLPQDCLYTVVESGRGAYHARVIGSLSNYLYAPDDRQAAIEKMSAPECRIVSMTITEGGYYFNQGSGEFEQNHPDITRDITHPHDPRSSFGFLAEALDRRRRRGLPPFTVMSCDNLQQNGDVARKMLLAFAELRDPSLRKWLAENCAFPNSMVDRITPATTDEHRRMLRDSFGIDDSWPVVTEFFRQWVIEDAFPGGRPPWECAGAQMTSDVLPYEKMKIRLLNAGHQALCYLGMLLGYEYVHEAIADAQIRSFVRTLMEEEVTPLLPQVPGIDLAEYKRTLIERFANPAVNDRLLRIGTDASARIPKFVLPSILEQLERGGPIRMLTLTVASWFRCLAGKDDVGKLLPIVDPLAGTLCGRALRGGVNPDPLLEMSELFGEALPRSPVFRSEIHRALLSLYERGTRATLKDYIGPG